VKLHHANEQCTYTNPADVSDSGFVQWPLAFPRVVRGAGVSLPGTYENGFATPYAQNWNFTIEKDVVAREVGEGKSAEVGGQGASHDFFPSKQATAEGARRGALLTIRDAVAAPPG
jgi:hypothetical protein